MQLITTITAKFFRKLSKIPCYSNRTYTDISILTPQ